MYKLYEELGKYRFILGSSSPRRQEILTTNLGIEKFVVFPSDFEENLTKHDKTAVEYVTMTSNGKADSILQNLQEDNVIVLCCDTIVCCNGQIFEKPITKAKQLSMFEEYRNAGNVSVISSITISKRVNGIISTVHGSETTELVFNKSISPEFVTSYVESEEGLMVAGGFKFQEKGSLLFNKIQGDYFNIVGLPVSKTFELLHNILEIDI